VGLRLGLRVRSLAHPISAQVVSHHTQTGFKWAKDYEHTRKLHFLFQIVKKLKNTPYLSKGKATYGIEGPNNAKKKT
jgi:hypothetical protein